MAHMAKEPFEVAVWPLAAVGFMVANAYWPMLDPLLLAYSVNAGGRDLGCGWVRV